MSDNLSQQLLQGLNHTCRDVYSQLEDVGPATVSEVADGMERAETTVRKALESLRKAGLVDRSERESNVPRNPYEYYRTEVDQR